MGKLNIRRSTGRSRVPRTNVAICATLVPALSGVEGVGTLTSQFFKAQPHLTMPQASRNLSNFDLLLLLQGNSFIDLYFRYSSTGNKYQACSGTTYATNKSISLARYTRAELPCA